MLSPQISAGDLPLVSVNEVYSSVAALHIYVHLSAFSGLSLSSGFGTEVSSVFPIVTVLPAASTKKRPEVTVTELATISALTSSALTLLRMILLIYIAPFSFNWFSSVPISFVCTNVS